jgi:hypothetical protein
MTRKPAKRGIVAKAVNTVVGHWRAAGKASNPVLLAGDGSQRRRQVAAGIAEELGVALYTVDLARVVGKHAGETEKDLADAFGLAGPSGAVLLFDEADALFGKRSRVKNSHDRYADSVVGYLRKRLARHSGPVLLGSGRPERVSTFLPELLTVVVVGRRPGAASPVPGGPATSPRSRTRRARGA